MKAITEFQGEHRFLSNFVGDLTIGKTVEHYFQAAKATNPQDKELVLNCRSPGQAKRAARKIKLREDWEQVKVAVMYSLLIEKFTISPWREKLLGTGDAWLMEGNKWHDNFWGSCSCEQCKKIRGQNWLGRLLMLVRSQISLNTNREKVR